MIWSASVRRAAFARREIYRSNYSPIVIGHLARIMNLLAGPENLGDNRSFRARVIGGSRRSECQSVCHVSEPPSCTRQGVERGLPPRVSSSTMTQPVTSIIGNGSSLCTPAAYELAWDEEPNMAVSGCPGTRRDRPKGLGQMADCLRKIRRSMRTRSLPSADVAGRVSAVMAPRARLIRFLDQRPRFVGRAAEVGYLAFWVIVPPFPAIPPGRGTVATVSRCRRCGGRV